MLFEPQWREDKNKTEAIFDQILFVCQSLQKSSSQIWRDHWTQNKIKKKKIIFSHIVMTSKIWKQNNIKNTLIKKTHQHQNNN